MNRGYTQSEALALVSQLFETHRFLGSVPRGTRGQVIKALDAGDHWNVLIEWELPRVTRRVWYDKFDVQNSMRPVRPGWGRPGPGEEFETVEIRSSHDLTAASLDARQTGTHSYQVGCGEFLAELDSWLNDKARRAGPLRLTTLDREAIWISEPESRRVATAIKAANYRVVLD